MMNLKSITVNRTVTVKVKVTEGFKKQLAKEVQETIQRLELEVQHLDFQDKRMKVELEKNNPQGLAGAKKKFDLEKEKRLEKRAKLMEKLKEVAKLPIGAEVIQGTFDSICELNIGDRLSDIMGVEVIVEDGTVIDIRQSDWNKTQEEVST
jgi:hypothetical protein